ncbi:homeobox protein 13-like [Clytia hemisphaerica]|uniref:TFIIS N-terminal domain-containing protein n=1 Tax=Clytia hemisphaerica TaxID=252671 RepID=A0A7M5WSY7_9CNID|eukprot:TCONS_00070829-protein
MDDFPCSQPNYDSTVRLKTLKRQIEEALKKLNQTTNYNEKENALEAIKSSLSELLIMGEDVTIGDLRVTKIGKLMTKLESSSHLPQDLVTQATTINNGWKEKLHVYRQQLKITLSEKKNKPSEKVNCNVDHTAHSSKAVLTDNSHLPKVSSTSTTSSTGDIFSASTANPPPTSASFMKKTLDKRANSFPPFMKREALSFLTTPQKTVLDKTTIQSSHVQQPNKAVKIIQSYANVNTHSFAVPSSHSLTTLSQQEITSSSITGSKQTTQLSFTRKHEIAQPAFQSIQQASFTKEHQTEQPVTLSLQSKQQIINQASPRATGKQDQRGQLKTEESKRHITNFTEKYGKLLDSNISSIILVQQECIKMMQSTHSLREQLSNFEKEMILRLDSLTPSSNTFNGDGVEVSSTSASLDCHQHTLSNNHQTASSSLHATLNNQLTEISVSIPSNESASSVANILQKGATNNASTVTNTTTASLINRSNIRHASPRENIPPTSTYPQTNTSQPIIDNISVLASPLRRPPTIDAPRDLPTDQSSSSNSNHHHHHHHNKPQSNLDSVLSTMTFHPKRKSCPSSTPNQKPSQDAPVAKKPRETLGRHFSEENTSFAKNSRLHPSNQSTPLTNHPFKSFPGRVNPSITCIPNSEDEFSNNEELTTTTQHSIRRPPQNHYQPQNGHHTQINDLHATEARSSSSALQQPTKNTFDNIPIKQEVCFEISSDPVAHSTQNNSSETESLTSSSDEPSRRRRTSTDEEPRKSSTDDEQHSRMNGSGEGRSRRTSHSFEVPSSSFIKKEYLQHHQQQHHQQQYHQQQHQQHHQQHHQQQHQQHHQQHHQQQQDQQQHQQQHQQQQHQNRHQSDHEKSQEQTKGKMRYEEDEELFTYSQQIVEMEEEEGLDEHEKNYLQNEKGKLRSSWNTRCKRAAGLDIAPRKKSHGRLVAAHPRPLGKEVIQKMLNRKKQEENIKKLFEQDAIWEVFDQEDRQNDDG